MSRASARPLWGLALFSALGLSCERQGTVLPELTAPPPGPQPAIFVLGTSRSGEILDMVALSTASSGIVVHAGELEGGELPEARLEGAESGVLWLLALRACSVWVESLESRRCADSSAPLPIRFRWPVSTFEGCPPSLLFLGDATCPLTAVDRSKVFLGHLEGDGWVSDDDYPPVLETVGVRASE